MNKVIKLIVKIWLIKEVLFSLIDYLFWYLILIIGIFSVFVFCNVACEYRNYRTGHRYIKSFNTTSTFQRLFTILQRSADINEWDMKKITHIGYVVAILCTATAVFTVPFSCIMFFFNRNIAVWTYLYWCGGCLAVSLLAFIVQVLDSILNYLLEICGK